MTRVAREFENLLLAVRSSVAAQRPATCELLDNLVVKTKDCFAKQKRSQYWGIGLQLALPAMGVAGSYSGRYTPSNGLQWGSKAGDVVKTLFDAKGFDLQATQKQIDTTSAELAAVNQGQATFLQSLETAMQRHQQIQDNAKR
ncbi:MAG TPA: hypothetical protein VHK67_03750 [Rhabdochlamydiaceae bacterium]|jgi:hypothetical protein|nr:hypothetical protein [Rhabdochlamydiaceae bacterium]